MKGAGGGSAGLLVEDEGIIRLVAAETLRDAGFAVVEAWDGDEAARLLNRVDGFDVLFTDVRMPGTLDGIDVAVHARRREPAIPVLVVSGHTAQLTSRLRCSSRRPFSSTSLTIWTRSWMP